MQVGENLARPPDMLYSFNNPVFWDGATYMKQMGIGN